MAAAAKFNLEDLFKAIKDLHWEEVERIINSDRSLLTKADKYGNTALHIACGTGYLFMPANLVRQGALDLTVKNNAGITPLDYISEKCKFLDDGAKKFLRDLAAEKNKVFTDLKNLGIVKEYRDIDNLDVNKRVSYEGIWDALGSEALTQYNILFNPHSHHFDGKLSVEMPLLHLICYSKPRDNVDLVRYLISNGASIKAENWKIFRDGKEYEIPFNPIYVAMYNGNNKIVDLLLEAGAKLDTDNELNVRVLEEACKYGHLELVKKIITETRLVAIPDKAFLNACEKGHLAIVRFLMGLGANVNGSDRSNVPLCEAYRRGHRDVVMELLENPGVDVTKKEPSGDSILLDACCRLDVMMVERVLNFDAARQDVYRVLNMLCKSEKINNESEIVKLLLAKMSDSAKLEICYHNLDNFCQKGYLDILKVFVEYNPYARNYIERNSEKLIEMAAESKHPEVVEFLKDIDIIVRQRVITALLGFIDLCPNCTELEMKMLSEHVQSPKGTIPEILRS